MKVLVQKYNKVQYQVSYNTNSIRNPDKDSSKYAPYRLSTDTTRAYGAT
jgi:hypothetical protein